MKAVITNPSKQHALVHFWRATRGDRRMDHWEVPAGGQTQVEVPSAKDDDQRGHVADQCRALGLSFREGAL